MAIRGSTLPRIATLLQRAHGDRDGAAVARPPVDRATPRTAARPGFAPILLRHAPATAAPSVLAAPEFERFLERERSLADRGTRRFSLLVITRVDGRRWSRRERERLAIPLRSRLRSTDLIGELADARLGVLLTDTGPQGAAIIADWLASRAGDLDVAIGTTIGVYPAAGEAAGSDGDGSAQPDSERDDKDQDHGGPAAGAAAPSGRSPRHASAAGWPTEDLWLHLAVRLPLWKRCVDIVASALALLVLSPVFLLVAIAIRLDSRGPVIYGQTRAGRGARPFTLYKFRSMTADAEQRQAELVGRNEKDGPIFKIRDDPRVTRVGRLLRCSSMDELPQLWNILRGDITLVGPRSPTFNEVAQYERWQRRRLSVMGGVTCIWQVSGRSHISFREWMRMDMRYIARGDAWMDLELLLRTLPAVLSGHGAY